MSLPARKDSKGVMSATQTTTVEESFHENRVLAPSPSTASLKRSLSATDEAKATPEKADDNRDFVFLPIITTVLSIVCPPIGCLGYFYCLSAEKSSQRYKWAIRSLYTASALAFVYAAVICFLYPVLTREQPQ